MRKRIRCVLLFYKGKNTIFKNVENGLGAFGAILKSLCAAKRSEHAVPKEWPEILVE